MDARTATDRIVTKIYQKGKRRLQTRQRSLNALIDLPQFVHFMFRVPLGPLPSVLDIGADSRAFYRVAFIHSMQRSRCARMASGVSW